MRGTLAAIAVAGYERIENGFPNAGSLHSALRTSKTAFLGGTLPVRRQTLRRLPLNQMKVLFQILFPGSTQKSLHGDDSRTGAQAKAKLIGARIPTMLFPMSLTLEGYHVCGGPVFE